MRICVAQTRPIKGDISANIHAHKKLIDLAITFNADAIFFSELSITGYEPELARELATNEDDKRLDPFQEIANKRGITIGIGVPIYSNAGILISMVIFQPNGPRQTYSKQQQHPDELPYFVCGESQLMLRVRNTTIAPAICYESLQPDHSKKASEMGAQVYLASVAKSKSGVDKAALHFPEIAHNYSMTVLMANCIGYCGDFQSTGKSSIWNSDGELLGQLDDVNEGLLIFDTDTKEIQKAIP